MWMCYVECLKWNKVLPNKVKNLNGFGTHLFWTDKKANSQNGHPRATE